MLLVGASCVIIGFAIGTMVSIAIFLLIKPQNSDLKNENLNSILNSGSLRSKRTIQKRAPKALTDLMAYNREIQEEGENRV